MSKRTKSGRQWSELDLVDRFNSNATDLSKVQIINHKWYQWRWGKEKYYTIYKVNTLEGQNSSVYDFQEKEEASDDRFNIDTLSIRNKHHLLLLIKEGLDFSLMLLKQGSVVWKQVADFWLELLQLMLIYNYFIPKPDDTYQWAIKNPDTVRLLCIVTLPTKDYVTAYFNK